MSAVLAVSSPASARPLPRSQIFAVSELTHRQLRVVRSYERYLARGRAQSARAARAVRFAYRQVGKPYQWGGAGPRSYDCSGLAMAAWRRGGLNLPHRADLQHRVIPRKVGLHHLRPGDLVFFSGDHHVGIYVGHRRFLHAPHTGARVQRGTLTGWRLHAFAGAARPGAPAYHAWPHWVRALARHSEDTRGAHGRPHTRTGAAGRTPADTAGGRGTGQVTASATTPGAPATADTPETTPTGVAPVTGDTWTDGADTGMPDTRPWPASRPVPADPGADGSGTGDQTGDSVPDGGSPSTPAVTQAAAGHAHDVPDHGPAGRTGRHPQGTPGRHPAEAARPRSLPATTDPALSSPDTGPAGIHGTHRVAAGKDASGVRRGASGARRTPTDIRHLAVAQHSVTPAGLAETPAGSADQIRLPTVIRAVAARRPAHGARPGQTGPNRSAGTRTLPGRMSTEMPGPLPAGLDLDFAGTRPAPVPRPPAPGTRPAAGAPGADPAAGTPGARPHGHANTGGHGHRPRNVVRHESDANDYDTVFDDKNDADDDGDQEGRPESTPLGGLLNADETLPAILKGL
jgi:hypothetical protein